jgi:PadR family transcriptional regulator, regulatory protein PadR
MDVQRKKGVLEICVLSSLLKEPSYGYKIVSDVSSCIEISESTLYPILRRLESAKAVSTYVVEHHGRLRHYYRIEEEGKKKIAEFLSEEREMKRIYDYVEGNQR